MNAKQKPYINAHQCDPIAVHASKVKHEGLAIILKRKLINKPCLLLLEEKKKQKGVYEKNKLPNLPVGVITQLLIERTGNLRTCV